ncbi:MAG: DUF5662 family protein [Ruminococcus callidus]
MGWHSFWGHFCTITRHRHTVMRHCRRAGIFWQGLRHDLSKYSPTEFWQGVRYYQDGKRSPNEAEREALGYSLAWMHHKGRNRHHFEYWSDYNPRTKQVEPVEMPVRFLAEMFCDRVAASKIYMKDAYDQTCPWLFPAFRLQKAWDAPSGDRAAADRTADHPGRTGRGCRLRKTAANGENDKR